MANSELAAFLREFHSNSTFLNPDIQNELITLLGEEILSSIFSEVKNASCFAEIEDKTTDKSIKSQLTERRFVMINQSNLKDKEQIQSCLI